MYLYSRNTKQRWAIAHLFPILHLVRSLIAWNKPGGSICTMEISKCCKSGFLFLRVVGPAFSSTPQQKWTEKNVRKTIVTPLVLYYCLDCVSTLMAQTAVTMMNPPAMQETWVQFLGREDPLEKEMEIHVSILAWRIPWTKESGGLQFMGSHRVRHDWITNRHVSIPAFSSVMGWVVSTQIHMLWT